MAECLVNEARTTLDFWPETWGDLLAQLDRALVADGRVVTAVRFDGVDQPSFRSAGTASAGLSGIARVDVDAAEASALLCATIETARESLPALVQGARLAADAFRSGALAPAHEQLTLLVQAVQSLITLTTATATAAEASAGPAAPGGGAAGRACLDIERALEHLVAQQADRAWPAVADALDELARSIAGWGAVLDVIRDRALA